MAGICCHLLPVHIEKLLAHKLMATRGSMFSLMARMDESARGSRTLTDIGQGITGHTANDSNDKHSS